MTGKRAVILTALVVLASLTPPASAQGPAPAPRVAVSGLLDFVTTVYKNVASLDITDGGKDQGWYSRERGFLAITGEVGRTRAVVGFEMDFVNGRTGTAATQLGPASGASLDLDTDEKAQLEVKWLYLETPVTGPGSLLPFVPVTSVGRFGGQPARGHDYKPGILFSGDFGGLNLETSWTAAIRSRLTWVQINEALDPVTAPGGTDDYAIVTSLEVDVDKGLTVKPTFAYARFVGGNSGTGNFGTFARGGFNPNAIGPTPPASNPGQAGKVEDRFTLGGDVRWATGPWSLQPTFYYQWGSQEVNPATSGGARAVDIAAWIFDLIGGYRRGPWALEGRFVWTSGMKAHQCVQATPVCRGGSDIRYYQPIHSGTLLYFAGWSEIEAAGIDYELPLHDNNINSSTIGPNPSYDKYGRIVVAGAVDYSVTPSLILHLVANAQWTDTAVDTDGVRRTSSLTDPAIGSIVPVSRGDARYLGTELNAGFTYRFAANTAFDLIGAVLFVGDARDNARVPGGARQDADDVYKLSARLRLTW